MVKVALRPTPDWRLKMDSSRIDGIMADAGEKLRKEFPYMEFFFILLPFEKEKILALSTEERQQMERAVISSASDTLSAFLNH